jgi:putative Holliday junction resolvase
VFFSIQQGLYRRTGRKAPVRRLGIDPGERRVGLALSEPGLDVAYPHKTIEHTGLKRAAELIAQEIRDNEIQEVVIGLPLRTDGKPGEAARRAEQLGELLQEMTGVKVVPWDERMTTAAAHRSLAAAGVRGKRRRKVVDQAAATLILQSYLDVRGAGGAAERGSATGKLAIEPGDTSGKGER